MADSLSGACLVTGASGFIGSNLIPVLQSRGAKIIALIRDANKTTLIQGVSHRIVDLTDQLALHGVCQGVDAVFHLAGYAHTANADISEAADRHQRVTVEGTRALLAEAAKASVKRFVYASSVKAMGEGAERCLDESSTAQPSSAYGRAKLEAEMAVLEAGKHGMHTSIVRFPLVYGRGSKGNIPRMIRAIDRGYFPPFPEVGNRRSLVHVDDAVQALLLASELPQANGETYIVTDGQTYSTCMIYEAICRALGRPVPRWSVPVSLLKLGASVGEFAQRMLGRAMPLNRDVVEKLIGSAWHSSTKISRELGFRPRRTFYDVLPEMIEEYRQR